MLNSLDQGINALQDIAKTLHDTDQSNIALVIVTAIFAVSTICIGIWNMKRTNSQIKLSEEKQEKRFQEQSKKQDEERFERVRPWITIEAPKPVQAIFNDGSSQPWEDFRSRDPSDRKEPITVSIGVRYINTGIRPAKNLAKIDHSDMTTFTREVLEQKGEKMINADLGPNQEQFVAFRIAWGNWLLLENLPLFVGIRISYDTGRNRSYSGAIYKIQRTWTENIASWYE